MSTATCNEQHIEHGKTHEKSHVLYDNVIRCSSCNISHPSSFCCFRSQSTCCIYYILSTFINHNKCSFLYCLSFGKLQVQICCKLQKTKFSKSYHIWQKAHMLEDAYEILSPTAVSMMLWSTPCEMCCKHCFGSSYAIDRLATGRQPRRNTKKSLKSRITGNSAFVVERPCAIQISIIIIIIIIIILLWATGARGGSGAVDLYHGSTKISSVRRQLNHDRLTECCSGVHCAANVQQQPTSSSQLIERTDGHFVDSSESPSPTLSRRTWSSLGRPAI